MPKPDNKQAATSRTGTWVIRKRAHDRFPRPRSRERPASIPRTKMGQSSHGEPPLGGKTSRNHQRAEDEQLQGRAP